MRYILILFLISQLSIFSFGQEWKSVQNFGGNGFTEGVCIKVDKKGNKYVAGYFQNDEFGKSQLTISCDTIESPNNFLFKVNSFIIKYDINNKIKWIRTIAGRIDEILIDESENYYAVGYFAGGFVLKYNEEGNLLWTKIVTSSQFNTFNSIRINNDGDLIVSGINNDPSYLLPDTFLPIGSFIAKLNPNNGDLINYKTFSTELFWISTLDLDEYDNIIIGGSYQGTILFNDSSYTTSGGFSYDGFIAKLDKNFSEIWFTSISSDNIQYSEDVGCIKSDPSGYYFSSGFIGTLTIHGIEYGINEVYNGYLSKMDSNGNIIWIAILGGISNNTISDLAISNSDIYVTGQFVSKIEFPFQSISSLGYSDLFVAKYSNNGGFEFATTAGSSSSYEPTSLYGETGNSIFIDSNKDVYVTGKVSGSGNFSSIKYKTVGNTDSFVAIISNDQFNNPLPSNCGDVNSISIYPNPTSDELKIENGEIISEILVYDVTGKRCSLIYLTDDFSSISLANLNPGMYLLVVKSNSNRKSFKIVKN